MVIDEALYVLYDPCQKSCVDHDMLLDWAEDGPALLFLRLRLVVALLPDPSHAARDRVRDEDSAIGRNML